ncbi:MAG: O-antigen ligase family protein, partial [Candidatus Aminicenantes bacterium]|nr:O-antigen ligase family protein [Candidatus Aminicenantes bacterium]
MNRTAAKILTLIGYGLFFAWFYYRYVPLIPAFQAVLAPILAFLWIMTAADAKKGLLAFCFIFPLINSLPYFFGIDETIPHAPAALVVFLVFVLGRLTGRIFVKPDLAKVPLVLSLKLLAVWGGISALITFLRYMDFFPWAASGIHELKVNVAGLSAGGARMSVVFTSASLLSGIAMFGFFRQAFADPSLKKRLVNTLTLSASVSFLFGYFQSFQSVVPGSTPYWNKLEQINATFKDPNSLAAFIAGFVPLVIVYALGQSGVKHALLVILGGLGLGLLPLSGSRSGMAAIAVAAAVFVMGVLVGAGKALRKRVAFHVAGFLLFFVAWNIVAVPNSALSLRIGWSIYQLKEMKPPADPQIQGGGQTPADSQAREQVDIGDFFNKRLILWSAAGAMFRTAPLTGVGLGAFIVTFPDYLKERGWTKGFSDSALNLAFQIGAETGLVGLIFSLAFLVGLVGR